MSVTISDNADLGQYEARLPSGELAGLAAYQRTGRLIVLTHTEVDERHAGEGIGSALAAGALDGARALGLAVVPLCPFIRAYIGRHPEYADLVFVARPSTATD